MEKKIAKKLEKINARIAAIKADPTLICTYKIIDSSVLAELRLFATWEIKYPVDEIHCPKRLRPREWQGERIVPDGDESRAYIARSIIPDPLWPVLETLARKINTLAILDSDSRALTVKISAATKSGPERRVEAKINFEIEAGTDFLAAHKAALKKLPKIRKEIAALQAEQKKLLPALRRANSEYLSARKSAKAVERQADADALASGQFWKAGRDALKDYFHPPFARNYLADVSERWRAALYPEMDSTAWKAGKGDWRHKNIGTGRGYLCGIDDNGDEWGHLVDLVHYLDHDQYGDCGYVATVEDAMSALFDIQPCFLTNCTRQGDLLFCPATIPAVELHAQPDPWAVRESHTISSPGLYRNGRWFRSDNEITVGHTSHETVTLPPGEYRLYALQVADAD